MRTPTTLIEAVSFFSDPDRAFEYAVKLRWPNGVACPRMGCGSAAVQFIKTRKLWRCKECKRQFTVKVGTIFEDSPIPFSKWLPAIWLLANTKNGTSSHELGRALGVTQKTAWFMFHRIREAMKTDDGAAFSGEVEADETFVGGKVRTNYFSKSGFRKLKHGPATGKTTVFGMVERSAEKKKSRVRAFVVPNHKASVLLPKIYSNVKLGSVLYTDALRSYRQVVPDYAHAFVDHSIRYVEGRVHTNCIENFWSCLKRTIKGTYIAPRPFHLDRYLDEQMFRFNAREGHDADRFVSVLKNTDGRRVTYNSLRCENAKLREGQLGPIHRPAVRPQ
jgi:transposase-like protein